MTFVEELHKLNVTTEQRIDATCKSYVDDIVERIRLEARRSARNGKTHIIGYIMKEFYDGIGDSKVKELGNRAYRDVWDFGCVYCDLSCTGFGSNDNARITREQFERSVLAKVRIILKEDGFDIKELRADSHLNYSYVTKRGLFRDKRIREYDGTTAVFCYVDLAW